VTPLHHADRQLFTRIPLCQLFSPPLAPVMVSYRTGIQHHPHAGTETLWRQIVLELRPHDPRVAMWSSHLAPDDPDLGALSFPGGAVDKCHTLAEVETAPDVRSSRPPSTSLATRTGRSVPRSFGILDTFDLQQRGIGIGVSLAALVGKVLALHIYCRGSQSVPSCRGGVSERRLLTSVATAGNHLDCVGGKGKREYKRRTKCCDPWTG